MSCENERRCTTRRVCEYDNNPEECPVNQHYEETGYLDLLIEEMDKGFYELLAEQEKLKENLLKL